MGISHLASKRTKSVIDEPPDKIITRGCDFLRPITFVFFSFKFNWIKEKKARRLKVYFLSPQSVFWLVAVVSPSPARLGG